MEKQGDIINKIRSTIRRYRMINRGDKVIVAVSGGPDSVCLLDALNRLSHDLEISLVVAHYNHGLRKHEDEFEIRLVRDIAALMGIPFEVEKASAHLKNSSSLEEKAREARYAFLEKIRNKHAAQKIAMGHNLNDQAETVLMRLLRGSGPSGLAGIPPVRDGRIIRPLIELKRDEIMHHLKTTSLPFALDSSNSDKRHLRNRMRLELVPMLLDYQPKILEHLGVLSKIIRDEDSLLESMALEWIKREAAITDPENISMSLQSINKLPDPLKNRVIRNILKQVDGNIYPMEYDHVISVSELLDSEQPQCSVDLPNGIVVKRIYDRLQITASSDNEIRKYSYAVNNPGKIFLDDIGLSLQVDEIEGCLNYPVDDSTSTAYLDAAKLHYPLIARNFKPGDRFVPLGMTGHKKIKNFFIDLKVPSEKRAFTPILTSGDKIVWVCGYRIDERFKVTAQTKRILKVTISER
jgi:tRNA(Ile)-lysidine synthase